MKPIYFTPGPSQLYPGVFRYIEDAFKKDIGSISHRGKYFQTIYSDTSRDLRSLMTIPSSVHIFFVSSSLESMERIIQNVVYESSYHFVNGAFSKKWYQFALDLGKRPEKSDADFGKGFHVSSVTVPQNVELICVTQNETSTGVSIPLEDIYTLRSRNPESLIALDIVSSAPYPSIDFSMIDMAFFSVQKGFGLPAGLGILLVNNRAIQKSLVVSKKTGIGTYHNFSSLLEMSEKNQTPETPNVLSMYLLGKVCRDILMNGIGTIRRQTDKKSEMVYRFAEKNTVLTPFVREEKFRSKTTIVLEVCDGTSDTVIEHLKKKGFIVGSGYGAFKKNHIRIANFPAHSIQDFSMLIKELKKIPLL